MSHESENRRPQVNESTRLSESFDVNVSQPEKIVKKNLDADKLACIMYSSSCNDVGIIW